MLGGRNTVHANLCAHLFVHTASRAQSWPVLPGRPMARRTPNCVRRIRRTPNRVRRWSGEGGAADRLRLCTRKSASACVHALFRVRGPGRSACPCGMLSRLHRYPHLCQRGACALQSILLPTAWCTNQPLQIAAACPHLPWRAFPLASATLARAARCRRTSGVRNLTG